MFITARKTLRLRRHEFVAIERRWIYVERRIHVERQVSRLDVSFTETYSPFSWVETV
jgi:hypothetical protein